MGDHLGSTDLWRKSHLNMIAGAAVIFAGIYLVTGEDGEKGGENS